MSDFDPVGKPHAVPFPPVSDLSQLYQHILKIHEHLNQFTEQWAIKQPDCPRISGSKKGHILSVPVEQFLRRRKVEVAGAYRRSVRDRVLRLWKPGMQPPPAEIPDPKNDVFNALMPWIMENIRSGV